MESFFHEVKVVKKYIDIATHLYTCLDTCMFSLDWFTSYASPTLSEMEAAVLSIFILHQGIYIQ